MEAAVIVIVLFSVAAAFIVGRRIERAKGLEVEVEAREYAEKVEDEVNGLPPDELRDSAYHWGVFNDSDD